MPSARTTDQNGFITIRDNPISKSGVFPYLGRSIGAPDPDKIYNVYRPAEAWDEEALASLKHIPLVDEHTMLGDGYTPAEDKGVHGHTGENVSFDGNLVKTDLRIYSKALKSTIDSGKTGLSLGYKCRYRAENGMHAGMPYSYVQDSIRGNHLAVVAAGRCGKDVVVLDQHYAYDDAQDLLSLDTEELKMAQATQTGLDAAAVAEIVKTAMDQALAPVLTRLAALDEKMDDDKDDDDDKKKKADKAEDETEAEKEARMKKEKADKDDDKKDKAMDAAEVAALVKSETSRVAGDAYRAAVREQSQKTELAGRISAYVGTFDHSEKTLAEVAAYGREKLGLADIGQDEAVLAGYFAAKTAPSPNLAFALDSKDSASVSSEINSFFSKGK